MGDLLYAPFYARLPSLPALSPSKHLHYVPLRTEVVPKADSTNTTTSNAPSSLANRKASIRPPSANMIQPHPHRRAAQFYDGHTVIVPPVQETVKIPTRTQHIKAQDAFLKQVEHINCEYSPSKIRTSRGIKAELLPSVLLECCKDEPCYAYLLSELAKAVERHKSRLKPAAEVEGCEANLESKESRVTDRAQTESPNAKEGPDDEIERLGETSGNIVSLAKLVAKKEIEASTYRKRMDHMKTTLTKLNKEIQIAKTTIGALNAEIARLESIYQISMESRAPGTLKERMMNLDKTAHMILAGE
ncbi:hypothetical protein GL50803_0016637 [Giardia duodenalis]|uniref:Uncharacterized protein n=1 Tax=Giardia intestinalis (strain ATCC 50803 / WB clone C6) TaxID=184922 RepID=A8B741_GIAIC|nr:hypothetical protein GL50803_0016637 [Giardia intestinalis]KAE8301787.1 hypothetical protein GL50803_0016637 [Giardia intestinalis]|eukprot:XP_001709134.1 Hypothetical protein GL50803_16637 [Giardia lamblia ATCC 50803]